VSYRDEPGLSCPRCAGVALSSFTVVGIERAICAGCGGVWIAEPAMQELLDRIGVEGDEPLGPLDRCHGTTGCPVCREPMAMERGYGEEAAGIVVDICVEHGVWFDRDELAPVLAGLEAEVLSRSPSEQARAGHGAFIGLLTDSVRGLFRSLRAPKRRPDRSRGRTDRTP
jgi:Zn-finger nucleic acid-binding protein